MDDIVEWNKLATASIFNGQELIVYFPKEKFSDRIVAAIPKAEKEEIILESTTNKDPVAENKELEESNILYHSIQKGETLGKISTYYPNVTLSEIIRINNFFGEIKLVPGSKIKIQKL